MKRIILYTIVFLLLFSCSISWEKTNDRPIENVQLSNPLKHKISRDTKGYTDAQIIEYGINLTADELRFSKQKTSLVTKQIVWDMHSYAVRFVTMLLL